jgi:hypothetical protein
VKNILQNKIKSIPIQIWILLAIVILGIFLRTYRFHDWLEIKSDQIRDAVLVHDVISKKASWPLLGPWVGGTGVGTSEINAFQLGPIYYWFEIISAKIFGDYPDKLAYPDLLFSILSIPLFYFFCKRYFGKNLSLGLAGLYAVSFFSIQYSRFAWNPNSIPFFVLLLLLSLNKFIIHKEKTYWSWAIVLGIALGVGIQLHIIALMIFPIITLFVFAFSTKKNPKIWKKLAVVLAVFLLLNIGQIISELKTNFSNSKIFISYFSRNSPDDNQESSFFIKLGKTIDCHIEANAYMLTSLGPEECSFYFTNLLAKEKSKSFSKNLKEPIFLLALLSIFLFSFFGYTLLFCNSKKEKDNKGKYFLRLVALYSGFIFLVILFALKEKLNFRYFNTVFFMPFLFLGFFVEYLRKFSEKFRKLKLLAIILLFFLVFVFNMRSIGSAAKELSEKGKTGYNADFMVQIEPLVQYLVANSGEQKKVYLDGDFAIMHISFPLKYFLERQGVELIKIPQDSHNYLDGVAVFYLSNKAPKDIDYKKIEQIYVFKLVKKAND